MLEARLKDGVSMKLLERREAGSFFEYVERDRRHSERWVPFVSKTITLQDADAYIEKFLDAFKAGSGYFWALWKDGRIIGLVLIKDIDRGLGMAELGYMIDRDHEGRGIVAEACAAMIDMAFTTLALDKLKICCSDENERSGAIPRKFGFRLEGTLRNESRVNGELQNLQHWALFRSGSPGGE